MKKPTKPNLNRVSASFEKKNKSKSNLAKVSGGTEKIMRGTPRDDIRGKNLGPGDNKNK